MKTLAALVFARGETPDAIVADFAARLTVEGVRVSGFIQMTRGQQDCACPDTFVLDLETRERLPVLQNLGRDSRGCRVDPTAIADVSRLLGLALARRPDLLVFNRFGRLESEGGGVTSEIAAAVTAGVPTLVCVADRYRAAWHAFAADVGTDLACTPDALHRWWQTLTVAETVR